MNVRQSPGVRNDEIAKALTRLRREVRWLKAYAAGATAAVALVLFCGAGGSNRKQTFEEIDVQRINIVEKDGRLALVIANSPRLPNPIIGGKEFHTGRTGPGMLFFNGRGDECGGLIYESHEKDGHYEAGAHFSFDQYKNDQILHLTYQDDGKSRSSGLHIVDRPTHPDINEVIQRKQAIDAATGSQKERLERQFQEDIKRGELSAERIFVGSVDKTAIVRLKDNRGRDRVRLYVDQANIARMEFLNDNGTVIYSIPPR